MILLARLVLALLFLLGGLDKITAPEGAMGQLAAAGFPTVLAWPVALFELAVGVAIVLGGRAAMAGGLLAALWIVPVNLIFHPFWSFEDEAARLQLSLFFKNVSIAGGLCYVALNERRRT